MSIAKRVLKITLISLLSIIVLVSAIAGVAMYIIFTPEKLTPIAVEQANKYLTTKTSVESVELTFFSTFPEFGLRINNANFVNEGLSDISGEQDTLLAFHSAIAIVDVKEFICNNNVVIKEVSLYEPTIYAFIDSTGKASFDIMKTSDNSVITDEEIIIVDNSEETPSSIKNIDIDKVIIKNANITYDDRLQNIKVQLKNVDLRIDGKMHPNNLHGNLKLSTSTIVASIQDKENPMSIQIKDANIHINGKFENNNLADATLKLDLPSITLVFQNDELAHNLPIGIETKLKYDLAENRATLHQTSVDIKGNKIKADGTLINDTISQGWFMDMNVGVDVPSLKELLALVPVSIVKEVNDVKASGSLSLDGNIKGLYSENSMPLVNASVLIKNIKAQYVDVPYTLDKLDADVSMQVDLNELQPSFININNIWVKAAHSEIKANGTLSNIWKNPTFAGNLSADVNLTPLAKTLPMLVDSGLVAEGQIKARINTPGISLKDVESEDFGRFKINGNIDAKNIKFVSERDTINATIDAAKLNFKTNANGINTAQDKHLLDAKIQIGTLRARMGQSIRANLRNANIALKTSNFQDTTRIPTVSCELKYDRLFARMDSIRVRSVNTGISGKLSPSERNPKSPRITAGFKTDSLRLVAMGNLVNMEYGGVDVSVVKRGGGNLDGLIEWIASENLELKDIIVSGDVKFKNIQAYTPMLPELIQMPNFHLAFTPNNYTLHQAQVKIGDSDITLTGDVKDLRKYLRNTAPLVANLRLESDNLDINQLMKIADAGMSSEKDIAKIDAAFESGDNATIENIIAENKVEVSEIDTSIPPLKAFMVPGDIIAEFDTHIKKARYSSLDIQDIQGKINMKDSIITVRELGLTSNAAEITLNAFYRPVNPNHIYANFDYHMVNIHIGELLKVVTDIDSLMPMLRSFDGKVDFHFAAETYLDSFYNMKYPTLRAASSIRGDSLLIQDGEVFSQIAKTLRFKNKKQQNLVDSLSVEFVVYKRQIEVYPFLISMDRYKVAIAGKHNLDMSFNYHVSLLSSPIPGSYGADISGNIDKLKIRLVKPRYKKMFVPTKHGVVESSQMEIRQKIRQSLVEK